MDSSPAVDNLVVGSHVEDNPEVGNPVVGSPVVVGSIPVEDHCAVGISLLDGPVMCLDEPVGIGLDLLLRIWLFHCWLGSSGEERLVAP